MKTVLWTVFKRGTPCDRGRSWNKTNSPGIVKGFALNTMRPWRIAMG
ncbi:MAG: hypothetical protein PUI48_01960 [Oscillospiraceae bacterium]|nr:hypothetical protein [Oscillospiraceae bacterium]MDY6209408.1 hypothetical protein [Oscillospiraceae bacterium]